MLITEDIDQKINQIIRDNMPQAVASQVSAFIDIGKQAIEENKKYKAINAENTTLILKLRDEIAKYNEWAATLKSKERDLANWAKDLQDLDLKLLRKEASIEASVANASRDATLNVVGLFLKNNTVRKSVVSTVPVAVSGYDGGQYSPGSPGHVQMHTSTHVETLDED